ncbi:MAG: hypothetical protein H0U57_01245 [Tatlockia sp.]|nr:hypothetical protein [Tatlockia sp.]
MELTANLSCQNSSNRIAELFGSIFESLKHSLESLTFRGLYGENTCSYLAQLVFENLNLTSLSVGAFWKGQRCGLFNKEPSYTGFNKESAQQLSHALRANKTLTIIDFSLNKNLMEGAMAIADSLKLNPNLQKIDFRNCSLPDDLELEFLDIFKHLTEVSLNQTSIEPSAYSAVIGNSKALEKSLLFLENTTNLLEIDLTFSISDLLLNNYLQRLNLVIEQNKSLELLELYNVLDTRTKINFLSALNDSINDHTNLKELVVRNSMGLNDVTIPSLIDLINSNRKLRHISVGVSTVKYLNNVCSKTACFSIFKALESNRNLISVNFSNNSFPAHDETANAIAKMLKTNKSLKSLDLSKCFSPTGTAVQIILSALDENQTLTRLNLADNCSYLTMPVIDQLRKNFSLTNLNLSSYSNSPHFWGSHISDFGDTNKIPHKLSLGIEQILERNIKRKISFLYQNLLLLTIFDLPNEVNKYIFILMLLTCEYGLFSKISENRYPKIKTTSILP